jgi:hypothetical protein
MKTDRQPMLRGRALDADGRAMELPPGKTCADCLHCPRCCAIYGHIPADEVCDFFPSRFRAATPAACACREGECESKPGCRMAAEVRLPDEQRREVM